MRFDGYGGGAVCGYFRAQQRFVQMNSPGGERPVLDEVWEVLVYRVAEGFLFDLFSIGGPNLVDLPALFLIDQ